VEGYVPPPTTLGVTEMVGEDLTRLEQQGRPTPAVAEVIKQRLAYAEAERRREERRSVLERAFTVFAEVRGGLTETQRQSIGR
jgi:hypothetical protein